MSCYQGARVDVLPDDNFQHGYICKKSYGFITYEISCTRQEVTQRGLTTIGEEKSFFYVNETENGGWRKIPKKTVNYQIEVEVEPELLGHVDNYVFEGLVNGKQSTCIFPASPK